jgi:hypothetical protein
MEEHRLRSKGWTEAEIQRLKGAIVSRPHLARAQRHMFWLVLMMMILAAVCTPLALFPIVLFVRPVLALLIMFIVGIVLGLLLTQATAHLERHGTAVSLLILCAFASSTVTVAVLQQRFRTVGGLQTANPLVLGIAFAAGMALTYLLDRRFRGPA